MVSVLLKPGCFLPQPHRQDSLIPGSTTAPSACCPPPAASLSRSCPCIWKASFTSISSGLSQKPWAQFPVDKPCGIVVSANVPESPEFLCMVFITTTRVGEADRGTLGSSMPPPHVLRSTKACGWTTSLQNLRRKKGERRRKGIEFKPSFYR